MGFTGDILQGRCNAAALWTLGTEARGELRRKVSECVAFRSLFSDLGDLAGSEWSPVLLLQVLHF